MSYKRRAITINLTADEILALRHILLEEREPMAEFFAKCARQYISQKSRKRPEPKPTERTEMPLSGPRFRIRNVATE